MPRSHIRTSARIRLLCALAIGAVGVSLPAVAQEYMMPWERAELEKPKADPDSLQLIEVEAGRMDVIRMPLPGRSVISSHPEVAKLHVEDPNLLFVIGQVVGETHIVVADGQLDPIYSAVVKVIPPRRNPDDE